MPLLRQREIVAADEWQTLADSMGDTPPADDVPLIVPFATFREKAAARRRCRGCAANASAPEASRLTMGVVSCT
jgi:uncharacterized protein (DUF934 family)